MAEGPRAIEQELALYRERIEELVRERTAEVARANAQLHREISERERAEKALQESEQHYRTLLSAAQRQTQESELLDRVRTAMARELELPIVFRTVVEGIATTFGYTQVSLYLHHKDRLLLQYQVGYSHVIAEIPVTRGITGRVVRSGKPELLQDVRTDPEFLGAIEGIVSEVCIPLFDEGRVVGVLNVESTNGIVMEEADLRLMATLGEHIGIAIAKARLYTEARESARRLQQQAAELQALRQMGLELTAQLDINALLLSIAIRAIELLQGTAGGFYLYRPDRDALEWATSSGPTLAPMGTIVRRGEGLAGKIWETGRPLFIDDYHHWEGQATFYADYPWTAVIGVPLHWGDEFLGVLEVLADTPRIFTPDDAALLDMFSTQAAIAIKNARLYAAAQQELAERKRAEEALRQSEEIYRLLVENAHEVIVVVQHDAIKYINPKGLEISGYLQEDLIGRLYNGFIHPDDRDKLYAQYASRSKDKRFILDDPFRLVSKDGEIKWMEVNAVVIPWQGEPAILSFLTDVTERKKAEEERAKLQESIQQAQKMESLGVLAGGIAHDFNNLLVAVLGNADLALMDLPSQAPIRGGLEEIKSAAIRASELCGQMLAYAGKGHFDAQIVNLNDLVREMGQLLQVSISKKAVLSYHLSPDLPAIEADAPQIRQIVMNLITNASESLGEQGGSIRLATSTVIADRDYLSTTYLGESLPEGRYARLEIEDTGCGMDAATQARIFEPFFSTKFAGRGLGLAAVLGIVRGHKGAIRVVSEPGKGTLFTVLLPASGELPDTPPPTREPARASWSGRGTVLVVDDEPAVRQMARRILERVGLTVLTAGDGVEALQVFRAHAPDVNAVLLDLTMPRMGGEETLDGLQHLRANVPVILASGYGEQETLERFAGRGLAGFVCKPFQVDTLLQKLHTVIDRRSRSMP